MNTRRSFAAAGAAAAVGAASCVLALPASAGNSTHTLVFFAITKSQVPLGKKGGASFDHDVNKKHKVIGYDVVSFTGQATGAVSVALKGGLLYANLHFTPSGALTGKVTGGAGAYAHASGTVTGHAITKKKTEVTVTYKL